MSAARTGPQPAVGPGVAVIATPGTTAAVRSLAAALARHASVTTWARAPEADAVIVTHPDAASRVPIGRPAAVVDGGALTTLGPDGRPLGEPLRLPGRHLVASSSLPPLAPHVRRRWRARLGLDPDLVVDTVALDPTDVPTALALAAAAVVELRHLPVALALGCPAVTDGAAAAAVGARPERDLLVGERADAVALAADPVQAARLSRAARALAVSRLDPETTVATLLERWGLGPQPSPEVRVNAVLAELGTAPGAPVRARVADALALFAPSPVPA